MKEYLDGTLHISRTGLMELSWRSFTYQKGIFGVYGAGSRAEEA
jgi:hypothetical protein